jgi:hypothetical protein
MENFHHLLGFHHFSEAINEWINGLDVDEEALIGVINLDKLHTSLFSKTFTVNSEDRSLVFGGSQDGF